MGGMRLVLLGDIHVYSLWLWPWDLVSKRVLGQTNVWLRRRRRFDMTLLPAVVAHAAAREADLALFTGDLTSTALRSEFRVAAAVLEPLLADRRARMTPGNHDVYTSWSERAARLKRAFGAAVPTRFPHFEMLAEHWYLLTLNSAVPRWFSSRGRVGVEQRQAIEPYLRTLAAQDNLIVLTHYPVELRPGHEMDWQHQLADGPALREVISRCPARTVWLHGHIHEPWCFQPAGEAGRRRGVVINAGAPCMMSQRYPFGQGYWQIDLPRDPAGPIAAVHHYRDEHGEWRTSTGGQ